MVELPDPPAQPVIPAAHAPLNPDPPAQPVAPAAFAPLNFIFHGPPPPPQPVAPAAPAHHAVSKGFMLSNS